MKRITVKIDVDLYTQFWALLPAININIASKELEFEWLCIGVYIGRSKPSTTNVYIELSNKKGNGAG